jgi:hypothetical protein
LKRVDSTNTMKSVEKQRVLIEEGDKLSAVSYHVCGALFRENHRIMGEERRTLNLIVIVSFLV